MTTGLQRVVIVGAGHAGAGAAALLRQHGFTGSITLIGEESQVPYHRPPLSKAYLTGAHGEPELLRPAQFYANQDVELLLGRRVAELDPADHRLRLGDGSEVRYDAAVLATGARPRPLAVPGADRPGVHTLRTYEDACVLRGRLGPGSRLVIIGGGYVGLEVAAAARRLGAEVTVLERADRVLARVAGPGLSAWLTEYHRSRGTVIDTDVEVIGFAVDGDGAVSAVDLADGRQIPCDVALVGVGAVPCDELARTAGLVCGNGIVVDDRARTSAEGVWAIGDVTSRPVHHYPGTHCRLESIPSAGEQAKQAVADILGLPAPVPEVPWFWSDQFDLKLQIAGLFGSAEASVVRRHPDTDGFATFHLDGDGRVLAVEAVNAGAEFMAGKKWIAGHATPDVHRLADPAVALRDLVPR
ncbi:NAD(P)/FAD-dependent oxidoreductase [Blastococcus sp. SYSU D00669]